MGQFDSFKSIAMLFTGAFLVSFGVIAFLNIEIQSRQSHGVKIRNENLFEVVGRKINQMISSLRERNSYRRTLLYHLFAPENTTSRKINENFNTATGDSKTSLRKLQYFIEDPATIDNMTEQYIFLRTPHRLRHEKKIKRLTELHKEKNNTASRETTSSLEKEHKSKSKSFVALFNGVSANRTESDNALNLTKKTLSEEEDLEVHQQCYTTNDVLEIIAITCLLNFIFWFMIIFCVNVFTRNPKMWKFNSFESLTSIGSGSECELNPSHIKKGEEDLHASNRQNFLKEYVNSLTTETERTNFKNEPQEPFSWSLFKSKSNSSEGEKWIHQNFIHFSNIFFDSVSLDNLKPAKKKNFVSRNKNNKIVNSFSMEDLIF